MNTTTRRSASRASLLLVLAGRAMAQDNVVPAGPIPGAPDSKPMFSCTIAPPMSSSDTDGIAGINGPDITLGGANWRFEIRHVVTGWGPIQNNQANQGALGVQVQLKGSHLHGPHKADIDPNNLPPILTDAVDITYGKARVIAKKWGYQTHPSTDGHDHHDHYTVEATITPANGAIRSVTANPTIVTGEHCGPPDPVCTSAGPTFGTLRGGGSSCAFDPTTGLLTFAVATISVMNTSGSNAAGIASAYTADPARNAVITITPLQYLGVTPEGRFRFGPGTLTLTDPAGKFAFRAGFAEYVISDTSTTVSGRFGSFAILEDLNISDVGDAADGPSTFLRDFRAEHIRGRTLTNSWIGVSDTDFSFVTTANLATLTGNFTAPASAPCDVIVTADRFPQPPVTATDLGELSTVHQGGVVTATIAPGQVNWYSFSIGGQGALDPLTWLDLDTIGSSLSTTQPNNTMIGLFDENGQLIVTDDDDGPGYTSQLSFGQRTPVRPPAPPDGLPGDGRDGNLPAGNYYLGVGAFQTFFGSSNWAATSASTAGGQVRLNVSTSIAPTPPPCYPNCDGSTTAPVLNVSDFTCYLQKYALGDPYANCDGSTVPPVLNVNDFTCYLQKYALGCT